MHFYLTIFFLRTHAATLVERKKRVEKRKPGPKTHKAKDRELNLCVWEMYHIVSHSTSVMTILPSIVLEKRQMEDDRTEMALSRWTPARVIIPDSSVSLRVTVCASYTLSTYGFSCSRRLL